MTRLHARRAEVVATRLPEGGWRLGAPAPGLLTPSPFRGPRSPREVVGTLDVLGTVYDLVLPADATGWLEHGDRSQTSPIAPTTPHHVGYNDLVGFLFPVQSFDEHTEVTRTDAQIVTSGPVYRAPTSGRYYGRSSPDKPPFVAIGTELVAGTTICLLEVMKTFNRVTYDGEPARVRELLVPDGADVNAGDPLLALEPI